jgi:thioredoxin-related protein
MKKLLTIAGLVFFLLLCGCVSKPQWLSDYAEGQKLAEKNDKMIFLLFTADETDEKNMEFKKIFNTPELKKILKGYVLVNIDFSESRYAAAEPPEDADDKAIEAAGKVQELLERDFGVAQKYSVQGLPMIYLLTKEGYVIATIGVDTETVTTEQFLTRLEEEKPAIDSTYTLFQKIKTTQGLEKVLAIDELYEATESQYRFLLSDFFAQVPQLDPNNESGVLGKFILQNTNNAAMQFLSAGDYESAIREFETIAENPILKPLEKQEALFTVAYLFANTGTEDITKILDYLQRAYDAAPDTETAPAISAIIAELKAQPQGQGE